jgi:hypothetical protein
MWVANRQSSLILGLLRRLIDTDPDPTTSPVPP